METIDKRDKHLKLAERDLKQADSVTMMAAQVHAARAVAHATLAIYYDRQAEFLGSL